MNLRIMMMTVATLFSFNALAMDGSSGCGPGWYLFKENSLASSAFRSTTNGFLAPSTTFGMTFGTSNCTQHKIVQKEKESLYFATQNKFELKTEAAKGQGEYLSAFASTIGCPANAQILFNQKLHANFGQIFSSKNSQPEDVLLEVYKTIFSDQELTQKCSLGSV